MNQGLSMSTMTSFTEHLTDEVHLPLFLLFPNPPDVLRINSAYFTNNLVAELNWGDSSIFYKTAWLSENSLVLSSTDNYVISSSFELLL